MREVSRGDDRSVSGSQHLVRKSSTTTSGLRHRARRPGMSPNPQMFAQDCSEEALRAICDGLFIPQRHHRIDAHGAARGQVSSNQTDRDHYCSGKNNRKGAGDWQVWYKAGG
jgi:hypothetical protein